MKIFHCYIHTSSAFQKKILPIGWGRGGGGRKWSSEGHSGVEPPCTAVSIRRDAPFCGGTMKELPRLGRTNVHPPPPLGTGNNAGRWRPREDRRPWGHQGASGCPFTPCHTVPCHLSRSDGDGTWNLCPGCSRGGCDIPQLSGETGNKVLIPWDTVEETLQVRTGMGCDLGAPCVFGSVDSFHPRLLLGLCVG